MSLRFLADHCISNLVIRALRDAGGEVFRLKDHIRPDSPDPVVLAKAQELDCILVSLNGDFADIVTYPPASYKGIIALQVGNHPEITPRLLRMLRSHLAAQPQMEDYIGKLIIVEPHRVRIRE
jgi:predicted nuclease of predicted toxin-antitoxin system